MGWRKGQSSAVGLSPAGHRPNPVDGELAHVSDRVLKLKPKALLLLTGVRSPP